MPRITTENVRLWARCEHWACPGRYESEVDGIRETAEYRMGELTQGVGFDKVRVSVGDPLARNIDRSMVYLSFADKAEENCSACGVQRALSEEKKKIYGNVSGKRQDGLLLVKAFGTTEAGVALESELNKLRTDVLVKAGEELKEAKARLELLEARWNDAMSSVARHG